MPSPRTSGAAAPAGDSMTSAPVGKLFFAAVTAVELGLICLLAPALTADLISGERERQTLDLLLVTPLSRRQIVVGKLVAALGSLMLLIVLALWGWAMDQDYIAEQASAQTAAEMRADMAERVLLDCMNGRAAWVTEDGKAMVACDKAWGTKL